MATLQELLRERQQVSQEWNEARALEVAEEKRVLEPAQRKAEAEARIAQLDEQIRRQEFEQRQVQNNTDRAAVEAANRALWEKIMALVPEVRALFPAFEAAEGLWANQQARALDAISTHAGPGRMEYLRDAGQLPNAVLPKFYVAEQISKITDPVQKRIALCLVFAKYGIENFDPQPGYNAQAETDQRVQAQRRISPERW